VFQSTPSGGKATAVVRTAVTLRAFQSTPSGGKATTERYDIKALNLVSIHAFRGEGDTASPGYRERCSSFNPRLPGGRRHTQFQRQQRRRRRFNPRLPGGRRHFPQRRPARRCTFQSTPSGGKATSGPADAAHQCGGFNPRLPGGRRPPRRRAGRRVGVVSIHAFRGEGDWTPSALGALSSSFNPRLPGGRRRGAGAGVTTHHMFQSTPSGGKATEGEFKLVEFVGVSIHAFRGEGDAALGVKIRADFRQFQSTPSGGKATCRRCRPTPACVSFNPRLPGGRRRHIAKHRRTFS